MSLAVFGLLMVVTAVWVSSYGDLRDQRDKIGRTVAVGWGLPAARGALWRLVAVPTIVGAAVTFVMAMILSLPPAYLEVPPVDPWIVATTTAAVALLAGLVVWLLLDADLRQSTVLEAN